MRKYFLLFFVLAFSSLQGQTISVAPDRDVADKRNFGIKIKWIKGKDVVLGQDSFCVVFFDEDVNGCYSSVQDKVTLLPYGADSAFCYSYMGVSRIKQGLILGYKGKAYELRIDTNGCKPVGLKARPDLEPPIYLRTGDQLPHFRFQLFEGDSVDVYSLIQPGMFTYIEFWGMWCPGCRQSIAKLQTLHATVSDSVTIISLDAYDNRDSAKAYVKERGMTWIQGYSNKAVEKLLYVGDGFPYGLLIDPQGRIVSFDVSPHKVHAMLKQPKH